MSIFVLNGFHWAVDKITIAEGDGDGTRAAPQVVSAVSTAVDRVRVTFNTDMVPETIGRFQDYRIAHVASGEALIAVGLVPVSSTQVDLITVAQENTLYEVTVTRVQDTWGTPIDDLANNTAQFAGTAQTTLYPYADATFTFYGLESGMQEVDHPDFLPDLEAPTIQNRVPAPSDTNVAKDAIFAIEFVDVENGVGSASVLLRVDGTVAWQDDAQQNDFIVTKTLVTNGFRYEINPPTDYASFAIVLMHVEASDQAPLPNTVIADYSFRILDYEAPYLAAQTPAPSEGGISPLSSVALSILDAATGPDEAAVVLTIGEVVAWSGDTLQNGFTGTKTSVTGGYHYVLTPATPFTPFISIGVVVHAADLALTPNTLDTAYSFDTVADLAPLFRNLSPAENASNVADTSSIAFDIVDNISVNEPTVLIFIDGLVVYENSVAKNGFVVQRTTISQGFRYEVTGPVPWRYGSVITIASSARDSLNTLGSKTWSIRIQEDPTCFDGPLNAFETSLLAPLTLAGTALQQTEALRKLLLTSAVDLEHPVRAMRTLFLRAHSTELSPVLRRLVPTPTARERTAQLCRQRSNTNIALDLQRKPWLVPRALQELEAIGLPRSHREMLSAYVFEHAPNTLVPLACLLVFLAKALESNDLL